MADDLHRQLLLETEISALQATVSEQAAMIVRLIVRLVLDSTEIASSYPLQRGETRHWSRVIGPDTMWSLSRGSRRLGHSNIAITLQIYSHVLPTMHDEAAMSVAALFMPRG